MAPADACAKKRKASARADMISELPDDILGVILSLQTVRDAARTTVLSPRWRRLFSSPECLPDTVDDENLWRGERRPRSDEQWLEQAEWRTNTIASSLLAYGGPIRRFCLRRTRPEDALAVLAMPELATRGVQELVVHFAVDPQHPIRRYGELPPSIMYCRELRSLSLAYGQWPKGDTLSPAMTLPHVTQLTLDHMFMTSEQVEALVSRCPALESLSLGPFWVGNRVARIRCRSLRSLTLTAELYPWVLFEDASNLERVLWWPPRRAEASKLVATRLLPKLQMFGVFRMAALPCSPAMQHGQVNAVKCVQPPTGQNRGVKTIALSINVYNYGEVKQALELLSNLPCLETLHLELTNDQDNCEYFSLEDMAGYIPCLEKHLKAIILRALSFVHQGHSSERNLVSQELAFAKFILARATVLETMTIRTSRSGRRQAERLLSALCSENRASKDARVVFVRDERCTLEFDRAASNIALADPFSA